jgi:hypothetical protein
MIPIWNDANSFKRHINAMKIFRLSHNHNIVDGFIVKDVPDSFENILSGNEPRVRCSTNTKGIVLLVPIWNITLPMGAQN